MNGFSITPGLIFGHALLILLMFTGFYFLLKYFKDYDIIRSSIARMKSDSKEREKIRKRNLMKKIRTEGEQEKIPLLNSLDALSERVGLTSKIPGFNGESLIVSILFISVFAAAITGVISHSLVSALIAIPIAWATCAFLLMLKSNQSKRKIEDEMRSFADIMQNYSYGTSDIKAIMKNTLVMMDEPLRGYLEECVAEMDASGDTRMALKHLERKANHEQFKIMIDKLYISSKHGANYAEVIDANKVALQQYFDTKESNKAIVADAKVQLIVIVAVFFVMAYGLNSIIEGFISMLLTSTLGHIVLGSIALIVLFGFGYAYKIENE